MRKKMILYAFIFIFFIYSNLFSNNEGIQFKISVRVFDKNVPIENFSKDDFIVSVNKKNQEISCFQKISRSISNPSIPFRHFILAFNLYDYGEQISEGIEYFIKNILTKNGDILVVTPKKVYKFSRGLEKNSAISQIKEIVKKDSLNFKSERATYENNLKEKIKRIRTEEISTSSAVTFLNNYVREWNIFKSRLLIPNVKGYKAIADYFKGKDGDIWFINFQQREIIPVLDELKQVIDKLRDYISSLVEPEYQSWSSAISNGLIVLEKSLLISDNFPREEIQNIMLGSNISFNVILFKSRVKMAEAEIHDKNSPDYEDILRNISKATGGITITTADLKEGLYQISQYIDNSYLINFPLKKANGLEIDIKTRNGNYDIYYKEIYDKEEIKDKIKILTDKIQISNVSLKDKRIRFILSNFSKADKSQGILEVKILIKNEEGNTVYEASNILKTFKDTITITSPPLLKVNGKNRIFILAEDKLTNYSSVFYKDFVF